MVLVEHDCHGIARFSVVTRFSQRDIPESRKILTRLIKPQPAQMLYLMQKG
jgi:hypothetical protein